MNEMDDKIERAYQAGRRAIMFTGEHQTPSYERLYARRFAETLAAAFERGVREARASK
jgi:hypothetical protein